MPSSNSPCNQSAQEKSIHALQVSERKWFRALWKISVYMIQVHIALSRAELCFRGVLFWGWVWVLFKF